MWKPMVIVMVLMPFIFAGQAYGMEKEDEPKEKNNQAKNVLMRMQKRATKIFLGQKQAAEFGAPHDPDLVDFVAQHTKNFPTLFSEENPKSVSNFLTDLANNKLLRGVLLRDLDNERHILINIENDYRASFNLTTSKSLDDIRSAEEEINHSIYLYTSKVRLPCKTQKKALKIILKELLEHYEAYQKKLSDLDGKSSDSIEIAKNSLIAFYNFFKEHHPVIFQMRKERCIFVQSFKNKYVYNLSSLVQDVNSNPLSEFDSFNDKGLIGFVLQHIQNYPYLFSKKGRQEFSNFVKNFKSANSNLLLNDHELGALNELAKNYKSLVIFATSENGDDVRKAEIEIKDRIDQFISDKEKTSTYKRQYKIIKIISKKLKNYPEKHHELISQIRKERCIFLQSLQNQYIHLKTINNYPLLIEKYEEKLAERKEEKMKANPPLDSRISGSLSSPKNSDGSQSPK